MRHRSSQISLSQIRAVDAVARTGSVLGAAEALGITQPSVSNHVRAVEALARAPIFTRNGKQFLLTPFGTALSKQLSLAVALADEIDAMLETENTLRGGHLNLAYSAHQYAMPVISEFARRFPGVSIEARCVASDDAMARVLHRDADACFVTARDAPEGMASLRLHRDPIVLMARPDHPLAGRDQPVKWREIAPFSIIRREESSQTRRIFEERALKAGVHLLAPLAVGSWSSMAAAVEAGVGLGIALAGEMRTCATMQAVPIDDPDLWACHYLVTQTILEQTAAISALFDIARETCIAEEDCNEP